MPIEDGFAHIYVGVWCNRTLSSNSQLLLSRTPSQICSLTLSKNTAVTHVQAEPASIPLYYREVVSHLIFEERRFGGYLDS